MCVLIRTAWCLKILSLAPSVWRGQTLLLYSAIIKTQHMNNDQVTKFVVEWMNWYYGEDTIPFPIEAQKSLTYEQMMEAMSKTEQIKKIVGRSR